MKIALLGYGKMGKVIEQISLNRGHEIVFKKDMHNSFEGLSKAEMAIEFSVPAAAVDNISAALNLNIPVVSGTTGWLEAYDDMVKLCTNQQGGFIYSSNFSLGVNIFFELNEYLAKIMANFPEYHCGLEEIHHTQKLDAPSGTAISLAQGIIKHHPDWSDWSLEENQSEKLHIAAKRLPEVPGTHKINYASAIDTISLEHIAHSREGFAFGAVYAAEWLLGKQGVYTTKDVFFGNLK